jgi:ketosteroid isomerase-like protein
MNDREAVLRANDHFYRVFEARDLVAMSAVWAQTVNDCCIHPGWEIVRGFPAVMQSWRSIFSSGAPMRFRITSVAVSIEGDVARVHNVENIFVGDDSEPLGRVAVTHLFVKREERWLMTLHHGSPIAAEETEEPPSGPQEFH